ncbi:hypothetical protein B0H14DRAFT_3884165, partial [Mycena olivaceomarginata]
MCGRGHLQCRPFTVPTSTGYRSSSACSYELLHRRLCFSCAAPPSCILNGQRLCFCVVPGCCLLKIERINRSGVADPVRAYRLVMLTGPPRLLEIRVVSPTPLSPPAYAYSDSPLADDSDLEPDPGLTWIDSDEESDTDTELTSPASDADLELDDFPYAWLMDRACFAALDAQPLINPVQCFAEVCWADAVRAERGSMALADSVSRARTEVHALVAARHWADVEELDPPLADEPHTPPQPEEGKTCP